MMKIPPFLPLAACAIAFACSHSSLRAQTIPKGDIVVDLENFAMLPTSSNSPARASVLRPAPDGRIFVNDQRGPMYLLSPDGATVTPYLNVARFIPLLSDNGERGFQSFAFHPDFDTPGAAGYGKFYTITSQTDTKTTATFVPGVAGAARDHDEVMLEWTAADPAASTFVPANAAAPFREVLRIARPNSNHDGGYASFNPTAGTGPDRGNLYYGMGDSGGGGDPLGLAQRAGNAYGAILRINPLLPAASDPQRSATGQYSIPADNPYTANAALLKEKFAGGFRNPQRFVWDAANGRMFVTDIGQNHVEEVDIGIAGANYGWNQREGSFLYKSDGSNGANLRADAAATGFTYPIAEYEHYAGSNAVTAGPVYRGSSIPGMTGRFLFCDFPTGTPYTINADTLPGGGSSGITELRLRVNGTEASFLDIIKTVNPAAGRADLRIGTDASRRIYFLNKADGVIRRVAVLPSVASLTPGSTTVSRGAKQKSKFFVNRVGDDTAAALAVPLVVKGSAINGRDYAPIADTATIPAGQTRVKVVIRPMAGGANGKVKVVVQPGAGYTVDAAARKVVVDIVD